MYTFLMEKFLVFIIFLFIVVGIPALIFYTNHRYRQRLKKAGLPPQGFLSSHVATQDLGKSLGARHPLAFSLAMILFGALMFFIGFPFFGAAFVLLFATLFIGFLFGWAVRAPQAYSDSVMTGSAQLLQETNELAKKNRTSVPKPFRFVVYVVMAVAGVLFIVQPSVIKLDVVA
jgi:predicted lipid-binding transport protein (Tim44 family)